MKTRKIDYKNLGLNRLIIGIVGIVVGIIINMKSSGIIFSYDYSFGNITIFAGIILMIFGLKNYLFKSVMIIDERFQKVINKSTNMVFVFVLFLSIITFIISRINPIKIDLSLISLILILVISLVYRISLYYYNTKY